MPATSSARPGRRPDPKLHQLWQQRLRQFERSGLSATAFCAQQRLPLPSFYAWRRRLRKPTPPASSPNQTDHEFPFLPIQLLPSSASVELVLPCGTVLRLAPGCDLAFVRSLVRALGGKAC